MTALGDGWLGKVVATIFALLVGALTGWFTRRPLEKAGVLEAVNKRIESYMTHLEGEVERITAHHARCEERLDKADEANRLLSLEVDQLRGQVAQEKQTAQSLIAIKDT